MTNALKRFGVAALLLFPLAALAGTGAVNTTPRAPISPKPLQMKLLVISGDGNEASLAVVKQILDELGTPYQVFTESSSPGGLTSFPLSDGTQGFYQGVILTSDYDGLTSAETTTLQTYEATYGVRQVTWFAIPGPSDGYQWFTWGGDISGNPITATFTPAAAQVFPYLNLNTPFVIQTVTAFNAQPLDANAVPLLVDSAGNSCAQIYNFADGRQLLSLAFDSRYYHTESIALAYGLVNWVTNGVFIGERHVFMSPQIDDILMPLATWANGDPTAGPPVRITGAEFQNILNWQQRQQQQPTTKQLRLTWCWVGVGATQPYWDSGTYDSLLNAITQNQSAFDWVSHTYYHIGLDGIDYPTAYNELSNVPLATNPGLTNFSIQNIITPGTSGLTTPAAMQAMADAGIRYAIMNPGQAPFAIPPFNTGQYNPLQPGILMLPRYSGGIYYSSSTPANYEDEYNYIVNPSGATHTTWAQCVQNESDRLLGYLLKGDDWLWYYHQTNCRLYDGTHTLMTDVLDAVLAKYNSWYSLPILSPPMESIGVRTANRMAFNASGVTGTLIPGQSVTLSVQNGATIPVTGLNTPGAELYGQQFISTISMAAGQSVTVPLNGAVAPASVSLTPSAVTGGGHITGTVTLVSPTPVDLVVSLTTNNGQAAAPDSQNVTVPAGSSSANFGVSTSPVSSDTSVNVSASAGGSTVSAPLTVRAPVVTGASVSPSVVAGGSPVNIAVSLSGPVAAPTAVSLGSSDPSLQVPASVTVPTGQSSVSVSASTSPPAADTLVLISAALGTSSVSASLTVTAPPTTASLSISPSSAIGGTNATGTITLSKAAPAGGATILLSSNVTSASLPAQVVVAAGQATGSFTISTSPVSADVTATITATGSANSSSAALVVLSPKVTAVTLSPTSVVGGGIATGTVTLGSAAPAGGLSVSLSSDRTAASVPAQVLVAAGQTTATFNISTIAVSADVTAHLTAAGPDNSSSTALTVKAETISSLAISPSTLAGGLSASGLVTIGLAAPSGGVVVALSSSSSTAGVPASVTVAGGQTTAAFSISTTAVKANATATITSTLGSSSASAKVTITPASLSAVSVNPASVIGGTSATGTVTLNGVAAASVKVSLTSGLSSVTVPTSVTVAPGQSSANFTINTTAVSATTGVSINASYSGVATSVSITVVTPAVSAVTFSPTSVVATTSSKGTVTLNGPAPVGGTTVTLTADSSILSPPATVVVSQGKLTATFTVTTSLVSSDTPGTVTAAAGGGSASGSVTVLGISVASLSFSPQTVKGGQRGTLTVTLNRAAPAGGVKVSLSTSAPNLLTLPATVNVLSGQSSVSLSVDTKKVTQSTAITATATLAGSTQTTSITITP